MHLKRWITGLLALPLLIFIIHAGGLWLTLLVAAAALAALLEYNRIVYSAWSSTLPGPIPVIGLLTIPALCWAAHAGRLDHMLVVLLINFLLAGMLSLFTFGQDTRVLDIVQKQIQGVLYIPLLLSLLILIRQEANGFQWIFTLVLTVFAGDTLAFYTGTYLGRHKLCPSISPGKTIEGSLGGVGANVLAAVIMKPFFPLPSGGGCCFSIACSPERPLKWAIFSSHSSSASRASRTPAAFCPDTGACSTASMPCCSRVRWLICS